MGTTGTRRTRWRVLPLFLALVLSPWHTAMAADVPSRVHVTPTAPAHHETVASLDVGDAPDEVGIETPPVGDEWGPSAFAIAPDSRFWIVDAVNSKLVVLDSSGDFRRAVPLPAGVLCPLDIRVTDSGVYLLDLPSQPATVHRLDTSGALLDSWEIPPGFAERAITGLRVDDPVGSSGPDLFLEIENAWEVPFVERGRRARTARRVPARRRGEVVDLEPKDRRWFAVGSTRSGRRYAVAKDWDTWRSAEVEVYEGDARQATIDVESPYALGAVRFVGEDEGENTYVLAEEIAPWAIRAFVKAYDPEGRPVRSAEIPLERFRTFPERAVRVSDDGDVYALVPGDEVEIVRLGEVRDVGASVSAAHPEPPATVRVVARARSIADRAGAWLARAGRAVGVATRPRSAHAIWDRFDAWDRAMRYCTNRWWCDRYDYYRTCGDSKPRYITSYNRHWQSVPYCWGGWDLPYQFNDRMARNYDAGDINCTGGKRWCTSGTDCSGLVSRLWGLGYKRSTRTLCYTSVSYYLGPVTTSLQRLGDIYVKPGSHVMMVDYVTSGGARVFESTTSYRYDRVVHVIRAWSGLSGYSCRRYNNWWR